MEQHERFEIIYTETAIRDIEEKADYISYSLAAPRTAMNRYSRLRDALQEDLTLFPFKFPA